MSGTSHEAGPLTPPAPSLILPPEMEGQDVYTLSPYARFLAIPHKMLSPAGAVRLREVPLSREWSVIIAEAAEIFDLSEALIASVIHAESRFQAAAVSPAGAQGAMQIMPETQRELGLLDPFDARANIYAGTQYLKALLDRFGNLELALAAYNAGPANVEKYGGIPPFKETQQFVRQVMAGLQER